jgi:hypothetical protein
MSTTSIKSRSRMSAWGWAVLLTLNALLILNSFMLYFFIAVEPIERTTSILLAGFGMFGLMLAWEGFRSGTGQVWKFSWITPVVLLALGINISLFGELLVGVFYLALTGIALVGQFLAGK